MAKDLGRLTTILFKFKDQKEKLNKQLKELNEKITETEILLLQEMKAQGLYGTKSPAGSTYISRQLVPKVVDWDAFYNYIDKHKYFHMLERRASRTAFKEQHELGQVVPGVEPVMYDELRTRRN